MADQQVTTEHLNLVHRLLDRAAFNKLKGTERSERAAEEFHRDTGMVAPFKSQPVEMDNRDSQQARQSAWEQWCVARTQAENEMLEQAADAIERLMIDVEAMRANLHATFNGGHQQPDTIRAFHHGMDTVCNVLEAHHKREGTNGIL